MNLSALLGSLLLLSGCGDSSQTEPDAGMGMGTGTCGDLMAFCDNCDDADNESACLGSASSMDETTCQTDFATHQDACFPESVECEQLEKICSQCTNSSDEANCGTIANSRSATAEGCANFDFTRFTTCPQP